MSKYLARLKALDFEKAPTSGTVKTVKTPFDGFGGGVGEGFQKSHAPFDGFDGYGGDGFQKSRGPFDGFGGSQGEGFSETHPADENLKAPTVVTVKTVKTSWRARAALLEAAGLPIEWTEPFAKLLCGGPPGNYDAGYWEHTLAGAAIFAPQWAGHAFRSGWSAEDVFGLDDIAPACRHDCMGLAWLLPDGKRVVALDGVGADIDTTRGVRQRFYR